MASVVVMEVTKGVLWSNKWPCRAPLARRHQDSTPPMLQQDDSVPPSLRCSARCSLASRFPTRCIHCGTACFPCTIASHGVRSLRSEHEWWWRRLRTVPWSVYGHSRTRPAPVVLGAMGSVAAVAVTAEVVVANRPVCSSNLATTFQCRQVPSCNLSCRRCDRQFCASNPVGVHHSNWSMKSPRQSPWPTGCTGLHSNWWCMGCPTDPRHFAAAARSRGCRRREARSDLRFRRNNGHWRLYWHRNRLAPPPW